MTKAIWIPIILILTVLSANGCGEGEQPLEVVGEVPVQTGSAPIAVPIFNEFDGVNPCTGLIHTLTFTGTAWIHEHDGRIVMRVESTITTSDGFEGRGNDTFVDNGNIQKLNIHHMMTNESGDRIRVHVVLVIDVSTTPPTPRVIKGLDEPVCVGA